MAGLQSLFSHELTIPERLMFLYAFIALGLVIALHISQLPEQDPIRWTKLTKESRYVHQKNWCPRRLIVC